MAARSASIKRRAAEATQRSGKLLKCGHLCTEDWTSDRCQVHKPVKDGEQAVNDSTSKKAAKTTKPNQNKTQDDKDKTQDEKKTQQKLSARKRRQAKKALEKEGSEVNKSSFENVQYSAEKNKKAVTLSNKFDALADPEVPNAEPVSHP